jgi:probable H4MPT-linked C1 transfer pathway protein
MIPRILGLDIGGANLKAADGQGWATTQSFPLWKAPGRLPQMLQLSCRGRPADLLAVTMTGELCDCFADRREGVRRILDAVEEAFPAVRVAVWSLAGEFLAPDAARRHPEQVASANWLATAQWCCAELLPGPAGLLLDIGSTTTDLVPLRDGRPVPRGFTDLERLACDELVYRGVRRTPLAVLADRISLRGRSISLMAELFATTEDVYLVLGELEEAPERHDTADGRPATRRAAEARLARLVGTDADALDPAEIRSLAEQFDRCLRRQLRNALWRVLAWSLPGVRPAVIVCGSGEFLARRVLEDAEGRCGEVVRVAERLGPSVSDAVCAHAVAVLARTRCV